MDRGVGNLQSMGSRRVGRGYQAKGISRGSNCILFLREDILAFLAGKFCCKCGSFDFICLKKSSFLLHF